MTEQRHDHREAEKQGQRADDQKRRHDQTPHHHGQRITGNGTNRGQQGYRRANIAIEQ